MGAGAMLDNWLVGRQMLEDMSYDHKFLIALGFSLVIEIIVILVLNRLLKLNKKPAEVIFAGFLATFSSIIYLWYILPNYLNGWDYLVIGEVAVLIYEMWIYRNILQIKWREAFLLSLIANFVSFLFGWFVL